MRNTLRLRLHALLLLCATSATAQQNKAAADVLFDTGKKLMSEKQYAEACPKFAESQRLDPAPGTLIWLADCYEQSGQTASAWTTYREALSAAKAAGQSQRETLARERIEVLEKNLMTVAVQLDPSLRLLSGLVVSVDHQPIAAPLWGTPIPYDPGTHMVEVAATDHKSFVRMVVVDQAHRQQSVMVDKLEMLPPPATSAAVGSTPPPVVLPPPAPPSESTTHATTLKTAGYVVAGVGLAASVTGIVLHLSARSKVSDAADLCEQKKVRCADDADVRDKYDSAKSLNTVGIVVGGLGGAALLGGLVMGLVTTPDKSQTSWLAPQFSPGRLGLSLSTRW